MNWCFKGTDPRWYAGSRLITDTTADGRHQVVTMNFMQESFTSVLAEYIAGIEYEALPEDVSDFARCALTDFTGCCIRGAIEDATLILGEELFSQPMAPESLIPTRFVTANAPSLARLYAASGHVNDFDDTHPGQGIHLGSPVIGAVLALATCQPFSGREVIAAIVAGYETAIRVGEQLTPDHYEKGFHTTGTVGIFGASAACGRLLRLDPEQLKQALGLATTQAAGVKCTFGTMAKSFNAGAAAANGLLSARLAARGYTAPESSLEEKKGFFDLYAGKPPSEWVLPEPDSWLIRDNIFKLHAACLATHPMIHGLAGFKQQNAAPVADIREVSLRVSPLALATASILKPQSPLEAKFCFPQIASLVLAGWDTASESSYSADALTNAELGSLREKITVQADPDVATEHTVIELTMADGQHASLLGKMSDGPSTLDELTPLINSKFVSNVSHVLGGEIAASLLSQLKRAESLYPVSFVNP